MGANYLGIDIGGTFIKYALMDEDASFIEQGKVASDSSSEEALLASLASIRERFAEGAFEGVAVSMPGRIDTEAGIAHTGGYFRWLKEYPAAERFSELFGVPATVANDGKCAALAESWQGALADVDTGAVIVLGTGIGGGIVLNRRVWMGASGGAGELSFFPTSFDALKEGIRFDTLDALWCGRISAKAISEHFAAVKELPKADGVALFDAYEAGDADAEAIVDEFAFQAAAGILSLQSALDLPRYAIGGGISARPEVTERIEAAFSELYDPLAGVLPFSKPGFARCRFGNEANLIGALAFHKGM